MHKAKSELQVKSKRISKYKAKSQKNTAEASQNKPKRLRKELKENCKEKEDKKNIGEGIRKPERSHFLFKINFVFDFDSPVWLEMSKGKGRRS